MKHKTIKFLSGDRYLYERYKIKHVIGRGNSVVYEVADEDGNLECVKEIRLEDKMDYAIFRKYIELLMKIKLNPHPNIVYYRGSYTLLYQKGHFNELKKGYIQMEKGITNLKSYLGQRKSHFEQEDILLFITNMIEVFAHLQKSEVAHRDIKPSNILIFSYKPLYFKVCDVGAGTAVGFCDNTKEMTVIGTPYYLSPELYRAHRQKMHLINYKAYKSDTYSLGLLIMEFSSLKKIEDRLNNEKYRIYNNIKEIKSLYPNIIGLGKVLRKMLEYEVTSRMDFIELYKYIADNNLLRSKIDYTLTLDPYMSTKIEYKSEISLYKLYDLLQLHTLVSTDSKFRRLVIRIDSSISRMMTNTANEFLEGLINIKYLELSEVVITMEMCEITDRPIKLIAYALEKKYNLTVLELNFWNNHVTNDSFQSLLLAIKTNLTALQKLVMRFSSNPLRINSSYEELFDFSSLNALTVLDIDFSFNDIQAEYLPTLLRQISQNSKLYSLSLNIYNVRTNPIHFAKAMRELYPMINITHLTFNVSCNSIRDEGIYSLGDFCLSLQSLKHCKLIIRNAEISDKGFMELMKTLSKKQDLKYLKLNLLNNEISYKGLKGITGSFESFTVLEDLDLNLSNNKLCDVAFKYLCNSVLMIKTLTRLRLIFDTCSLTQKGCLYIGRLISEYALLEELDLSIRYNDVKFEGVQYICAGLIKGKKIKKLKISLENTKVGDYSANYLAGCLLRLRNLTNVDLNLENCDLSAYTMTNIVRTVNQCCHSTYEITIDMRKNQYVKLYLYEQIKSNLYHSRVAIKVDIPVSSFITA